MNTLVIAGSAGILLTVLADRLRVPSVVLVLVGGILLGPSVLGVVDPRALGHGLDTIVTLGVAVVLFDGGLGLDLAGFRHGPRTIVLMLTLGVLVSWVGAALGAQLLFPQLSPDLAVLAGSLTVVTGPTVIMPILRRVRVHARLHHILYWEGIVVDAVGAFIAVLTYEWIITEANTPLYATARFLLRFVVGISVGAISGLALRSALKREWAEQHNNLLMIPAALMAMGISNAILSDSGIMAAVVCGFFVGARAGPHLTKMRRFGLELSELAVSLLFLLLAANLDVSRLLTLGLPQVFFVGLVVVLLRPLNIHLSTRGQRFSWREKLFLSWVAPRGIVAASMASLFALRLEERGYEHAWIIESLVYAVIATTVVVQGMSSPLVARILRLERKRGSVLILGDSPLCEALQRELRRMLFPSRVVPPDRAPHWSAVSDDVQAAERSSLVEAPDTVAVDTVVTLFEDARRNAAEVEGWRPIVGDRVYGFGRPRSGQRALSSPRWGALPSVRDATAAMRAGTHVLEAIEVGAEAECKRLGSDCRPFLAFDGRDLVPVNEHVPSDALWVIVFRRRIPNLRGLVRDCTTITETRPTRGSVADALVALARRDHGELDADGILDRCEREGRDGVDVHVLRSPSVSQDTAYMATFVRQRSYRGSDGKRVGLAFLVLCPREKCSKGCQKIEALRQLGTSAGFRETIAQPHSRARQLSYVHERE